MLEELGIQSLMFVCFAGIERLGWKQGRVRKRLKIPTDNIRTLEA
jgi:hypothetical protein